MVIGVKRRYSHHTEEHLMGRAVPLPFVMHMKGHVFKRQSVRESLLEGLSVGRLVPRPKVHTSARPVKKTRNNLLGLLDATQHFDDLCIRYSVNL